MKEKFPNLHISLNGGVTSLSASNDLLAKGIDGVMIGRSAYQQPRKFFQKLIERFLKKKSIRSPFEVAEEMHLYLKEHCEKGGKPHQVTRHMIGLFHGLPGAKIWRQYLSNTLLHNNIDFYDEALVAVNNSMNKSAA